MNSLRGIRRDKTNPSLACHTRCTSPDAYTWLDVEQQLVLPRSPVAAAITYAQNQWQALTTYTTEGYLNIDNNASERALKRVAIGRNYVNSRIMLSSFSSVLG